MRVASRLTRLTVATTASRDGSTRVTVPALPFRTQTAPAPTARPIGNGCVNNRANPSTDPTDLLARLPAGTGLLVIDADRVAITDNVVTGNDSVGIAVISLPAAVAPLDPRVDPIPDDDHITDNTALANGANPDPRLAPFPPADLLWDRTGTGNCWAGNTFMSVFPNPLPACAA
jgi:hypothetical protein